MELRLILLQIDMYTLHNFGLFKIKCRLNSAKFIRGTQRLLPIKYLFGEANIA